jgi:hypothetical protein
MRAMGWRSVVIYLGMLKFVSDLRQVRGHNLKKNPTILLKRKINFFLVKNQCHGILNLVYFSMGDIFDNNTNHGNI